MANLPEPLFTILLIGRFKIGQWYRHRVCQAAGIDHGPTACYGTLYAHSTVVIHHSMIVIGKIKTVIGVGHGTRYLHVDSGP
jgi:hypothetical protein